MDVCLVAAFNCLVQNTRFRGETTLNLDGGERVVRIRRKLKQQHHCHGKGIFRREQLELTIPSKFRDVVEPFLDKDLKVEAKREGNNLIIKAAPIERLEGSV